MRFFVFCYWHDEYFKKQRGGPIKVWELSDNLQKLGHKVLLFAPKLGQPKKQTSVEVVEVPFININFIRFFSFDFILLVILVFYILRTKPDVLYMRRMASLWPLFVSRLSGIPLIIEVNDDPYIGYEKRKHKVCLLQLSLIKTADRINFTYCDKISVVTPRIRDILHCRNKVPLSKMVVIPSGANVSLFKPLPKRECRRMLTLDTEKRYIGFVGTFFKDRGVDILIDCTPSVLKQFPDAKFLIVGDGPMKGEWMRKVSDERIENSFIFTGWVPYELVPKYMGAMDVCTAPFLKSVGETSAIKIFDYFACGRPVIASEIKPVSDFLIQTEALLVPPEDPKELAKAIVKLLSDERLRERIGRKGREVVIKNYSREAVAKKVIEISKSLLL